MARKSKQKWEYGDFQTPSALAREAVSILAKEHLQPKSILEPTCGKGSFLLAAATEFPHAEALLGLDLNPDYLAEANHSLTTLGGKATLIAADFFSMDWSHLVDNLREPILILGNPPWVTSSDLATLKSRNIPAKSNFQKHKGYEAKTGKSNFDISESMLLKNLEWLRHKSGVIAVLCKTAVARKILLHAWKTAYPTRSAKIFRIDAQKYFGASVDACFFIIDASSDGESKKCEVYDTLSDSEPASVIGFHDDIVLADVSRYERWRHLKGTDGSYIWRSGIKHDCSKVMELEKDGRQFKNGLSELVSVEDDFLYPMLKSSDIGNGSRRQKYMLVTQQYTGESTDNIKRMAPRTWRYLNSHEQYLDRRGSSIYRNRPRFSIFGVGPYSFSPWKVAISGFYSDLNFRVIGPIDDKAVVFDDTVYFLSSWSKQEAEFIYDLLKSEPADAFYRSMIFWSDKRPITAEVLNRLDLRAVSRELGREKEFLQFFERRSINKETAAQNELALWA